MANFSRDNPAAVTVSATVPRLADSPWNSLKSPLLLSVLFAIEVAAVHLLRWGFDLGFVPFAFEDVGANLTVAFLIRHG